MPDLPKMYKPDYPKRLPAGAEIVDRDGKPHVKMKARGRDVFYRVTKDGTKYLKPLASWYARVVYPNGVVKLEKLSTNQQAAHHKLDDIIRGIAMGEVGAVDPYRKHKRTPLLDHLGAWAKNLRAEGVTGIAVRGTRLLTRRVRERGAMRAAISTDQTSPEKLLDRVLGPLRGQTPDSSKRPSPNLIPVSLALNAGIYNALFGLRAGAALVIMERFEPAMFALLVRRFSIRSTVLPPPSRRCRHRSGCRRSPVGRANHHRRRSLQLP